MILQDKYDQSGCAVWFVVCSSQDQLRYDVQNTDTDTDTDTDIDFDTGQTGSAQIVKVQLIIITVISILKNLHTLLLVTPPTDQEQGIGTSSDHQIIYIYVQLQLLYVLLGFWGF